MIKLLGKKLQEIFLDSIKSKQIFNVIEGENPFKINIGGQDYYIYIKNLSSAYFSNEDVWRIQLPIKDIFNEIKQSDIKFILLGYDYENDVFATWNPKWAKQRLNEGKSVSFYSRLSLQKKAKRTNQIETKSLNNEGLVICFPKNKLSYVIQNIDNLFMDNSDYVAMGSKRRTEANEAYKKFINPKSFKKFYVYLRICNLSKSTCENYYTGIVYLYENDLLQKNRKLFLSKDSLSEYPDCVKELFKNEILNDLDNRWNHTYHSALSKYIKALNTPEFDSYCYDDIDFNKLHFHGSKLRPSNNNEEQNIVQNGKLIELTDPVIIEKIKPFLDPNKRDTISAMQILAEEYSDKYPNMQFKDWGQLVNGVSLVDEATEYNHTNNKTTKGKTTERKKIKITFPDGNTICPNKVKDALEEVIKYAGLDQVYSLHIKCMNDTLISKHRNTRYIVKDMGDSYYLQTNTSTETKLKQIKLISDRLNLGLIIELI